MYWGEYVSVAERRAKAKMKMEKLKKQGKTIEPIEISGRSIVKCFWGIQWCDHIESLADYESRLKRGKTYVRNGSVCHLTVEKGIIEAMVSGSELYKVKITIQTLIEKKWTALKKQCTGQINTLLDFLKGKIPESVMQVVADPREGLFPSPSEISYSCSCPDWADMCKHVAAVLYGIGNRLDNRPELLFHLRGVDPSELVSTNLDLAVKDKANLLDSTDLSALFDINLDPLDDQFSKKTAQKQQLKKDNQIAKKEAKSIIKKQPRILQKLDNNTLTGNDFCKFRLKNEWTTSEFAAKLKVTPASIYRWEASQKALNLRANTKEKLRLLFKNV